MRVSCTSRALADPNCDSQALREASAPLSTLDLKGNHIRDAEAIVLARALSERHGEPLAVDLSTNSLSATSLLHLRQSCTLTAHFQKPLCMRTVVSFDKCVYGAIADATALYLAHGAPDCVGSCVRSLAVAVSPVTCAPTVCNQSSISHS